MTVIFHVDMDAFYASVEQNDNPGLKGKPVIIGAKPGTRGVVSACSYEARKFGVHSAMPISEAYRRCPEGVYLKVRMRRYQEVSRRIMSIFNSYTPEVHQISIDEAFLVMTGTQRLFGPPDKAAALLKREVLQSSGCTLSIGIAENHFLAKLASEYDKPDGLYWVQPGEETAFLDTLELRDLWGVGKKMLERLEELNITTIPRLRQFSKGLLSSMFGKAAGAYLYDACRGKNPGIFEAPPKSQSISSEITFPKDTRDRAALKRVLLEVSHQLMFQLLNKKYISKTVCLKIRFEDFSTTTVQTTLRHPLSSAEEIYSIACSLLDKRWNGSRMVRLIGLGLSSVEPEERAVQQELFEDDFDRKKKVEKAVLEISRRMPEDAVVKASLLRSRKKGPKNPENP